MTSGMDPVQPKLYTFAEMQGASAQGASQNYTASAANTNKGDTVTIMGKEVKKKTIGIAAAIASVAAVLGAGFVFVKRGKVVNTGKEAGFIDNLKTGFKSVFTSEGRKGYRAAKAAAANTSADVAQPPKLLEGKTEGAPTAPAGKVEPQAPAGKVEPQAPTAPAPEPKAAPKGDTPPTPEPKPAPKGDTPPAPEPKPAPKGDTPPAPEPKPAPAAPKGDAQPAGKVEPQAPAGKVEPQAPTAPAPEPKAAPKGDAQPAPVPFPTPEEQVYGALTIEMRKALGTEFEGMLAANITPSNANKIATNICNLEKEFGAKGVAKIMEKVTPGGAQCIEGYLLGTYADRPDLQEALIKIMHALAAK